LLRVASVLITVLMSVAAGAVGSNTQADEVLGKVSFPTSCAADVQGPFERGVALLHSFVYEDAESQFADVFKKDPHCSMALWGQAMSIYFPLWFPPNSTTIQHGQELLAEAQKVGARTERERSYIDALAVFYQGSGTKYETRTAKYAEAMQKVAARYSDDHEATIFYALALLGATPPKDEPLANRKKAAELLKPLYTALPNHPGVIHYLIHAYDTPSLAELGLPMTRRYAAVAPSAPHAVHMPAHIFSLLGLWQDDIDSNLAAERIAQQSAEAMGQGHVLPLHFLDFLSYAYLQIGREDETKRILDQIIANVGSLPPMMKNHGLLLVAEIQERSALELREWSKATSLKPPDGASHEARAIASWAQAIGAARIGDLKLAQESLDQFDMLESTAISNDPLEHARQLEASAWVAHTGGAEDRAIRELREADELQRRADTTAHDWMGASAREMLGDLLQELKRPSEALMEYKAALRLTPNRFDALYGAARAATEAGKPDEATVYYSQVVKNCQGSTSERPELVQARAFLSDGHSKASLK
jgi:tetratricopeptide (TPR) repeat protein